MPDEPGAPPWPAPSQPGARFPEAAPGRTISPLTASIIAVVAVAVLAIVLIVANGLSSSPSAASSPGGGTAGGAPAAQGPVQRGGGSGGDTLLLAGQVTAVSTTSITISAQAQTITGAITSATQFNGQDKSTSAIKPGDRVTVQISGYGSARAIVKAIRDPAQIP